MARRRRRNGGIKFGTVILGAAAIGGGIWAYKKFSQPAYPLYNPVNTNAIVDPVTGRSPSGLRPGDPGFTSNVPAGF